MNSQATSCGSFQFVAPPDDNLYFISRWLKHWGRDNMAAIFQTTFSNAFSWMKIYEFRVRCHWSLFLRVQLPIFQYWFWKWLGADQATNHYLNQWWLVYRRKYASPDLNELNIKVLMRQNRINQSRYWIPSCDIFVIDCYNNLSQAYIIWLI